MDELIVAQRVTIYSRKMRSFPNESSAPGTPTGILVCGCCSKIGIHETCEQLRVTLRSLNFQFSAYIFPQQDQLYGKKNSRNCELLELITSAFLQHCGSYNTRYAPRHPYAKDATRPDTCFSETLLQSSVLSKREYFPVRLI